MEYLIGFIIATFIALTGVGAGTITVPVLVLFLGVPAPVAVSIGLMFATAVKLILVPAQIARKNVVWRTLGYMLLGGARRVFWWVLLFLAALLVSKGSTNTLNAILGAILVSTSGFLQIYSFLRPARPRSGKSCEIAARYSPGLCFRWAPRFGFSLPAQARWALPPLLSLTPLLPAQVVGTDIAFGFVVSLIGSGAHFFSHASNPSLLMHLIAGGILGAVTGTVLSTRIPRRPLRFALLVWLLILGGQFLFNSYHVWTTTR